MNLMGLTGIDEIDVEFLCGSGGCETMESVVDEKYVAAAGM